MRKLHKIPEENLKLLNNKLNDIYGRTENLPNFRVVWSEDLLEKRLMSHTDEGFQLIIPMVREVPKYKQWIQQKYILEGLTVVPDMVETDLVERLSYEPVWVFEDKNGNPLIPIWPAIHFILEQIKDNQRTAGMTKYPDPGETREQRELRLKELEEELFGNETDTGDALAYREGVTVPNNYQSRKEN